MARAYMLALFSHFVTKLLADLHVGLYGPEALVKLFEAKPEPHENQDNRTEENEEEVETRDDEKVEEEKPKRRKPKNRLDRFKRKRPGEEEDQSNSEDDSYEGK